MLRGVFAVCAAVTITTPAFAEGFQRVADRDGFLLFHQPGNYSEDDLEGIVKQAESLDMDEVRAEIARERAKATKEKES